jgi:hypothetical protein
LNITRRNEPVRHAALESTATQITARHTSFALITALFERCYYYYCSSSARNRCEYVLGFIGATNWF